ncbi:hypothetical protein HO924_02025 [Streptococcus suis]|nr:hypothetical protein [Streptococcus suis]
MTFLLYTDKAYIFDCQNDCHLVKLMIIDDKHLTVNVAIEQRLILDEN